ncbi:MAG: CHAD domain-containing protein [Candidatus Zixiibacteriota bacterium]
MTKHPLLSYYSSLIENWDVDFHLSLKFADANSIHDLRVDTKRIRAFLGLVVALNPEFDPSDILRYLRKPFKSAALIRHYQVQMELTRRFMDELGLKLDCYYNHLKSHELKSRRKFRSKCADLDQQPLERSTRQMRRALAYLNRDELAVTIARHVEHLLGELCADRNRLEDTEIDYHAIRILAKTTRYSLEVLRKCVSDSPALESLDRSLFGLHQALGAWHDLDLAGHDLESDKSALDDANELCAESLAKFGSAMATERDLQFELFRSRWIDFLDPAGNGQSQIADVLEPID